MKNSKNVEKGNPVKKFKTDLFLGNYWCDNLEYSLTLNEKTLTNIKIGENLTEEILQFYILHFLTNSPSMKGKDNSNSNFVVIMERFLSRNFKSKGGVIENEEELYFIQNINHLNKEAIFIPLISVDGIWNLAVIENIGRLVNPEIVKNDEMSSLSTDKPKFTFFIFDKLQIQNRDICKKLLDTLENFMSFYIKIKFGITEKIFKDPKGLAINSFNLNFKKLLTFKILNDTGLIISKIIMESVSEGENMLNFMNTADFNEFATEGVSLNNRDILKNKYSDALLQNRLEDHPRNTFSFKNRSEAGKQKEILELFKPRKTSKIRTNLDSFDSRKKMNSLLDEFFDKIKNKKPEDNEVSNSNILLEVEEPQEEYETANSKVRSVTPDYVSNKKISEFISQNINDLKTEKKLNDKERLEMTQNTLNLQTNNISENNVDVMEELTNISDIIHNNSMMTGVVDNFPLKSGKNSDILGENYNDGKRVSVGKRPVMNEHEENAVEYLQNLVNGENNSNININGNKNTEVKNECDESRFSEDINNSRFSEAYVKKKPEKSVRVAEEVRRTETTNSSFTYRNPPQSKTSHQNVQNYNLVENKISLKNENTKALIINPEAKNSINSTMSETITKASTKVDLSSFTDNSNLKKPPKPVKRPVPNKIENNIYVTNNGAPEEFLDPSPAPQSKAYPQKEIITRKISSYNNKNTMNSLVQNRERNVSFNNSMSAGEKRHLTPQRFRIGETEKSTNTSMTARKYLNISVNVEEKTTQNNESFLVNQMKKEFNKKGPNVRRTKSGVPENSLIMKITEDEKKDEGNCTSCDAKCQIF